MVVQLLSQEEARSIHGVIFFRQENEFQLFIPPPGPFQYLWSRTWLIIIYIPAGS